MYANSYANSFQQKKFIAARKPVATNHARSIISIIQPKLTIGQSGDKYEKEADSVSDKVLRMSNTDVTQRIESGNVQPMRIQRMCPGCEEEKKRHLQVGNEDFVQAKHASADSPQVSSNLESRINSLTSGGQSLDPATRNYFEPRFGNDFSHVRVHHGGEASNVSRSINARAFTLGNNIVFDTGQYQPQSSEGKRLLGHELTHVVQQGAANSESHVSRSANDVIQRVEPVSSTAATVTIGAVAARCIIGAIVGVLFDAAIQAALFSWRERTLGFWRVTLDWCSIILSAILGCIAGPISAYMLEPWIAARLGPRLGGIAGTLIGKILLFIAKKLGMTVPKGMVGTLLKLNCISPEQSSELGVPAETVS